eukprot:COSAG02_NODE_14347_length_1282_cov_0.978867_1_plen_263_part_00
MAARSRRRRRLGSLRQHLVSGSLQLHSTGLPEQPITWDGVGTMLTVGLEAHTHAKPLHDIARDGLSEAQLMEWTSRGLLVLTPQQLQTPMELHQKIFARCKEIGSGSVGPQLGLHNYVERVPELLELLNAPGVDKAIASIIGEGWAIVPWTHNHIVAGYSDQHWHKDDLMPSNARRPGLRQHYPQTLDFFYYPQETTELMAPTAFVPYSQYWTYDHDENQEHWAIEMLDNDFWMNNRGSSPDLDDRDRRLQSAVDGLEWCVP